MKNIILISGATGVGTTSVALAIARQKGILYVVGTDSIREAARQLVPYAINPFLHKSSYLAGKSRRYEAKPEDVKKEKIVRGFKTQSSAVKICIDGIINRYTKEDSPVIIEGINLIPGDYGKLNESGNATHILVDLENEALHYERLQRRIQTVPTRSNSYLENFREIRWLRDYLVREAIGNKVLIVDNSSILENTITKILSLTC